MDVQGTAFQFVLNVVLGAVSGGLTSDVSVRLLFQPRKPFLGVQGAIPKNKERLARAIGKTMGERLLAPADLAAELNRPQLRAAFDDVLARTIASVLDTERGSLRDLLPPAVVAEVERSLDGVTTIGAAKFASYVASDRFEQRVIGFVARTRAEIADEPVGTVLTPARREAIAAQALLWAESVAQSPELDRSVREWLAGRASALIASERPVADSIAPAVVDAVDGAIEAFLPAGVEARQRFMHEPAVRDRVREALDGIVRRLLEDLRFHERVIARLLITERTLDQAITSIETEGVDQLVRLFEEPGAKEGIARALRDAALSALRRPAAELVGPGDGARANALVDTTADVLLRVLRAEPARDFLVARVAAALAGAERRTWGELLAPIDDGAIAQVVTEIARGDNAQGLADEALRGVLLGLLDRPIGRPARWLPRDAPARLAAALSPPLWQWLQSQAQTIAEHVDVPAIVERRIASFSSERVEELVRSVAQRELRLIIVLGYLLGAVIGVLTFTLVEVAKRL